MVRHHILRVGLAAWAVATLSLAGPVAATADDADSWDIGAVFDADQSSGEGAAQVVADYTRPGTDNNPVDGYSPDSGQVAEGIGFGGTTEPTRPAAPPRDICSPTNPTDCFFTGAEPTPPPAGEPAVTLRDVATFQPAPHEHTAEPAGWAVVDLPANAVAEAGTVTRSGTLFARPVQVRFHPVGYRWVYSDGATVGSADPGATWAELGQREFTATPTSHVYRSKGEHTARLDVTYVAEYRFDGSAWRWVDGTLTVQGAPQPVLVGDFDTVLVTGPCTTHPGSPGCG
ncbi:hypothetical protein AVP42_00128 [Agromyces sp. NDB4Y10]|nr:hypothetical protein AVP42_00128 [Agromyces sp. NDB4Y10]